MTFTSLFIALLLAVLILIESQIAVGKQMVAVKAGKIERKKT